MSHRRFARTRKSGTAKPKPAPEIHPKLPWQKSHKSIPPNILAQVRRFKTDNCVVSCAKKLKISDIEKGLYVHLGIRIEDGNLAFPKEIIPPGWVGTNSRYNRIVREIVHKDLPKTDKSWDITAPNYGDSFNGTHTVTFTKEVYQRTYERPKLNAIVIEYIGEDTLNSLHILKFTVEEILDRTAPNFLDALLTNINLLQENIGNHGVFQPDATAAEYLRTLYVNWEILPPGEREETFTRILSGIGSSDPKVKSELRDRYEFLYSLKPESFIRGSNGFRSYFGALFAPDLVVFETVEYGNAIYIMFDAWEELSKRSRTELLNLKDGNYVRILHTSSWKMQLRATINAELRKRQKKD